MRADRLIAMTMLLQRAGRLTVADIAARLEVSERTVYRDIEALGIAGVPVTTTPGPGGGVELPAGYRSGLSGLSGSEIRSLLLATAPFAATDLGQEVALTRATLKLLATLPEAHRAEPERASERIHLDPTGWANRPRDTTDVLPTLQDALWSDRRLRLVYRDSEGAVAERMVEPLGLVAKGDVWYLLANRAGTPYPDGLRSYRAGRILSVDQTDEPFTRPEGFDLPVVWRDVVTRTRAEWRRLLVRVRFAPEAVPLVTAVLSDTLVDDVGATGTRDDLGWLRLDLHFPSFADAHARLLGFGPQADVLDPPELRARIIDSARATVAAYEGRKDVGA